MDKSWIYERDRFTSKYITGVESFIQFAMENAIDMDNKILCPCNSCRNFKRKSLVEVRRDLHLKGFYTYYQHWVHHGESASVQTKKSHSIFSSVPLGNDIMQSSQEFEEYDSDGNENDELPTMIGEIRDAKFSEPCSESNLRDFERLLHDATQKLYPGCTNHSLLNFIVKLLHIKVMNKISNKAIDMILQLFKEVLPDGNVVLETLYLARKLLYGIGLGYTKIDACRYDCALYWKENENETCCPICKEPRWKLHDGKGKQIPQKVLWYFPLTPRLQRLYMSSKTAFDMRWHAEIRSEIAGTMSHPADSPAWKDFDLQYPNFASDPRNVRLGLATDGFNPFGNMSNSYSMWPIVLIPYNMPLYKDMKDEFFMMPLLISGPRGPGKDIDVYLRPLIDELKQLWNGVEIYDVISKKSFQMRVAVLWTINDFPALSNLSGWITKGYAACPCCLYDTDSRKIRSKICYMGHRRYLGDSHPFRRSKLFDGKPETRSTPREWTGQEVLLHLNNLEHLGNILVIERGNEA